MLLLEEALSAGSMLKDISAARGDFWPSGWRVGEPAFR